MFLTLKANFFATSFSLPYFAFKIETLLFLASSESLLFRSASQLNNFLLVVSISGTFNSGEGVKHKLDLHLIGSSPDLHKFKLVNYNDPNWKSN